MKVCKWISGITSQYLLMSVCLNKVLKMTVCLN